MYYCNSIGNNKGNNLDFEESLIEKDEESIDESDILIDDKLEDSYIESDLNVEIFQKFRVFIVQNREFFLILRKRSD